MNGSEFSPGFSAIYAFNISNTNKTLTVSQYNLTNNTTVNALGSLTESGNIVANGTVDNSVVVGFNNNNSRSQAAKMCIRDRISPVFVSALILILPRVWADVDVCLLYTSAGGNLTAGTPVAGKIPLSWLGRPGAHLQSASSISGPWQNLPATDGTNWTVGYSSTNGFVSVTNCLLYTSRKFRY